MAAADPAPAYLRYAGVLAALLATARGLSVMAGIVRDESEGLIELLRGTGLRPRGLLASRTIAAAVGVAVLLLAAAGGAALSAPALGATRTHAVQQVLGQWPVAVLFVAVATLMVAIAPRAFSILWLLLAAGAVVALLGTLLGLPEWLIRHGPFTQAWRRESLILAGIAVVFACAGVRLIGRREMST
ncbi:MAG: hypothetical protein V9G04_10945 [Nocardioides sp.]|jgi:ABC-2 type transport system permease protein